MEINQINERKRIRIKNFNYTGAYAYFVTICAFEKQNYFKDAEIINNLLFCLKQETDSFQFSIFAYCIMPNHLHLLLVGDEDSNLVNFVKIFKQKTGYYFKQKYKKRLWQKSFFDHVLRKKEDINDIAGYIFNNPVRKELVDDFRKYPYLGSFVIDVNEFYEMYAQRKNFDVDFFIGRR